MFYNNWYSFGSPYAKSFTSTSTTSTNCWWNNEQYNISEDVKKALDIRKRVQQEENRWKEKDDAMDEYISQISVLGA